SIVFCFFQEDIFALLQYRIVFFVSVYLHLFKNSKQGLMYSLNCKGRLVVINEPLVMGIINMTPDSFYAGSRAAIDDVLQKAEKMILDGADILDIGGQSTRPGSSQVDVDEELQRVLPAVDAIHRRFPDQLLSIDSFYAKVVRETADAGISIVNDVSAGSIDEALLPEVARLKLPYILMHMPGTPQNMQNHAEYQDVVTEVFDFLSFRIAALVQSGIHDIIVDPGFGFGKTSVHNFKLLHQLSWFKNLDRPIMVGLSRKATIYKTLGVSPADALNGTTVLHTVALMNGASILRVHDVKEAREAIILISSLSK
ncbi:MAG: dihydropteroate synthase, partial [Flavisolibacter sp.]